MLMGSPPEHLQALCDGCLPSSAAWSADGTSLLAAHCALLAASQPANHRGPSPRAGGKRRTADQRAETTPQTSRWRKEPRGGSGQGEKRQKLQEFSFFHHVSYMAFLYSPCLFFFMDSRTINTIKELTRIYPLTALMCLHVLEKAAVQSVQAHVLSLNSRRLTVMVEDRIKSPKSLKWLKKWCLV